MPFLAFGGLVGSKTSALNCFEFAKVSPEFFRVMHGCNFVVLEDIWLLSSKVCGFN